jgi:ankyrin repeat protein
MDPLRPTCLTNLAPELLLLIADQLGADNNSFDALNAIVRTSRYLHSALNDHLYRLAVQFMNATPLLGTRWNRILHGSDLYRVQRFKRFLDHGLNVNTRLLTYQLFSKGTILLACTSDSEALARLLVEKGADVNATDSGGYSPLHEAVWRGKKSLVALLLEHGANIDVQNEWRITPLRLAVEYQDRHPPGEEKLLTVLLASGANPNTVPTTSWKRLEEYENLKTFLRRVPGQMDAEGRGVGRKQG